MYNGDKRVRYLKTGRTPVTSVATRQKPFLERQKRKEKIVWRGINRELHLEPKSTIIKDPFDCHLLL